MRKHVSALFVLGMSKAYKNLLKTASFPNFGQITSQVTTEVICNLKQFIVVAEKFSGFKLTLKP